MGGYGAKNVQVGIWIPPDSRDLLHKVCKIMGKQQNQIMDLAFREWVYNHQDEIEFHAQAKTWLVTR